MPLTKPARCLTLKHYQRAGFSDQLDPLQEHNLWQHVIYRCITGSQAYGLERHASAMDRRGIYLPPATIHWSLYGVPEQLENPDTEEVYWELEKFLKLALKANANVLEVLWSPIVDYASPLAEEMLSIRQAFLSTLVYQTFNGYAISQFKKLGQDMRNKGAIKWKHAMHLIRLLYTGIGTLRTGEVPVEVPAEHREHLLAIRDGRMDWETVDQWRRQLHSEFEQAYRETDLPDRPDYDAANAFLIKARLSMVDKGIHDDE